MGQFIFNNSYLTTWDMKIILALFGFLVTTWCFPKPILHRLCFPLFSQCGQDNRGGVDATQNCQGSQCGQDNGAGVSATQNCQGSQCQQDNAGTGAGGSDGGTDSQFNRPCFPFCDDDGGQANGGGVDATQNCQGSQCGQDNRGGVDATQTQLVPVHRPCFPFCDDEVGATQPQFVPVHR